MKSPTLNPTEIADLLNFVLSREPIDVFVVKTWSNHQCWQVEHWCENTLVSEGLLPKPTRYNNSGRPANLLAPLVVRGLVEASAAKAKAVGR